MSKYSLNNFAKREEVAGAISEGFSTTALPAAIAPMTGSTDNTVNNKQKYTPTRHKNINSCLLYTCRKIQKQFLSLQKGKFQAEITKTTPSGSETICADEGNVVTEVLT